MNPIVSLIVLSILGSSFADIGKGTIDDLPCSFDDNTWCKWTSNGFKLTWPNGNESSLLSGPRSKSTPSGRGLVGVLEGPTGEVRSAALHGNGRSWWPDDETEDCFSFSYFLAGPDANLTVSFLDLSSNRVKQVFQASSKAVSMDGWKDFVSFVPFPKFNHSYLISGIKGPNSFVAIDNFNISRSWQSRGLCAAKLRNECTFDTFLSSSSKQSCPWMILQGSPYMSLVTRKPTNVPGGLDHSTRSPDGGVLTTTFEGSLIQNWDSQVHFRSKVADGPKCLSFWMNQPDGTSYQIDFKRGYNNIYEGQHHTRVILWSSNQSVYNEWFYKNFTLNVDVPIEDEPEELYSIVFQMVKRNGSAQVPIALDSIKVTPGPCPAGISCDFNRDTCSFMNGINQNNQTPFMIGNGRLVNPNLLVPEGFQVPKEPANYAYIDSTGSTETYPKIGELVHNNMPSGKYCVRMRYVSSQDFKIDDTTTNSKGSISTARNLPAAATWSDFRFTTGTNDASFKFVMRIHVLTGFFAMSNLSITNGPCVD